MKIIGHDASDLVLRNFNATNAILKERSCGVIWSLPVFGADIRDSNNLHFQSLGLTFQELHVVNL